MNDWQPTTANTGSEHISSDIFKLRTMREAVRSTFRGSQAHVLETGISDTVHWTHRCPEDIYSIKHRRSFQIEISDVHVRALCRFGSYEAMVGVICFGDAVTGLEENAVSRSK